MLANSRSGTSWQQEPARVVLTEVCGDARAGDAADSALTGWITAISG